MALFATGDNAGAMAQPLDQSALIVVERDAAATALDFSKR